MPQSRPVGPLIWGGMSPLIKLKKNDKIPNKVSALPASLGSGKPRGLLRSFTSHGILWLLPLSPLVNLVFL